MSSFLAPSGVSVEVFPYEDFQGIDASRDEAALDTGKKQHMLQIKDGFADWRGTMVRDPGAVPRGEGNKIIKHVAFFGRDLAVYALKDGGGVTLSSDRASTFGAGHELTEVYPSNSIVTSTVFNSKTIFATRGQNMRQYDGMKWDEIIPDTDNQPAYIIPIQRRLATAGHAGNRTTIDISRVDDESVFTEDEDVNASQVTKASDINIGNIIGTADEIRGLGVFESNRLAVFTNDQTLIYVLHPDYTQWTIDDKANVNVGTISHNTIARAGNDLLFCARDGVHSLRRSETNGVTIYSLPLSSKIDTIYRSLINSVTDTELINAYYDQDNGQYHVFFPQTDLLTKRLTMTVSPIQGGESKWSTADFLNTSCGRSLGGVTIIGTPGGVWNRLQPEDVTEITPDMEVITPILWQGAINDTKTSYSFILQATGTGVLQVEAFDEDDRTLSSFQFDIDDSAEDDRFFDVPLSKQYERKFEHRYRGVKFKFTTSGDGLLKIIGFAVTVRK